MRRYCAYQERCHEEVRSKLITLKVYGDNADLVVQALIEEGFLNEERFACAYAGGKFRMKKWGRLKIIRALELRKISAYCIKKAMEEIPASDYTDTLRTELDKAMQEYSGDPFVVRNKAATRLISKGFEPALVWEMMQREHPHRSV